MENEDSLRKVELAKADLLVGEDMVAKKVDHLNLVDLAVLPRAVFDPRLLVFRKK